MLRVPDVVAATLSDSQSGEVWAEASYQGATTRLDVLSGSVTWDADGEVETSCSFEVGGVTDSLVPRSPTDFLAPNGQEVTFYRDLIYGDQSYTIPLGRFRVKDNDGGVEVWQNTVISGDFGAPGTVFVTEGGLVVPGPDIPYVGDGYFSPENLTFDVDSGLWLARTSRGDILLERRLMSWRVGVSAAGRMRAVQQAKRLDRLSPVPGNTMWDEVRRVSLFPVAETVPDRSVPASLAYEDTMQAHRELAALAGCVPSFDRYGALIFRETDRWATADPATPEFDFEGTVSWAAPQDDGFYNEVVASSPDGSVVAVAAITDDSNPFSIGRAGRRTLEHSSPLYSSFAAAQAGAWTRLESVQRRSQTVTVECLPEALLLDMGDVGWMRDPVQGRSAFGEVIGMRMNVDPTDTVQVELRVREVHG